MYKILEYHSFMLCSAFIKKNSQIASIIHHYGGVLHSGYFERKPFSYDAMPRRTELLVHSVFDVFTGRLVVHSFSAGELFNSRSCMFFGFHLHFFIHVARFNNGLTLLPLGENIEFENKLNNMILIHFM